MPYALQSDLLLRMTMAELTQLTDDTKSGAVNPDIVAGVLAEASGTIDDYARTRYTVPLQPSDTVTRICRDVSIYLLYSRRPAKMPEVVRQRYEDAIALLEDVSGGKASFDQQGGTALTQGVAGGAALPTCSRLRFTDCNLKGYV